MRGTYHLSAHALPRFGIKIGFAGPDRPETFPALIDDRTKPVCEACESCILRGD